MAGLDDYQFYTRLQEQDNPFWERANAEGGGPGAALLYSQSHRPSDLPQSLHNSPRHQTYSPEGGSDRYSEMSVGVGLLAEHLLSHPFIVLRRVCQVDVNSRRHHLLPITIVYAAIKSRQGSTIFWKGLGSVLIVKGLTIGLEDLISKFTPLPKEVFAGSSLRSLGQHLLLKCTALALATPFIAASLVETVQSNVACDCPGMFDVFKEGLMRLLSFTQPQTGRLLPIWLIVVPTVSHGILQYILGNAAARVMQHAIIVRQQQQQAVVKSKGAYAKHPSNHTDPFNDTSVQLQATFLGHMFADVFLFPMETVVHRLQLQGTRTIIDSLDSTYEVKPILTRYEGFWDCFSTTLNEEGPTGLLKGFGALCLQYAAYGLVLKFTHVIVREVSNMFSNSDSEKLPEQPAATPLAPTAPYTSSPTHLSPKSTHSSPRHVPPPGFSSVSPPLHSSPARKISNV